MQWFKTVYFYNWMQSFSKEIYNEVVTVNKIIFTNPILGMSQGIYSQCFKCAFCRLGSGWGERPVNSSLLTLDHLFRWMLSSTVKRGRKIERERESDTLRKRSGWWWMGERRGNAEIQSSLLCKRERKNRFKNSHVLKGMVENMTYMF